MELIIACRLLKGFSDAPIKMNSFADICKAIEALSLVLIAKMYSVVLRQIMNNF